MKGIVAGGESPEEKRHGDSMAIYPEAITKIAMLMYWDCYCDFPLFEEHNPPLQLIVSFLDVSVSRRETFIGQSRFIPFDRSGPLPDGYVRRWV